MNKQEMRRLGLLPYEEDTSGWMTTRPRRRRNRHIPDEIIDQATQQLSDNIDQQFLQQLTRETGEIHPNRIFTGESFAQRAWRIFVERVSS